MEKKKVKISKERIKEIIREEIKNIMTEAGSMGGYERPAINLGQPSQMGGKKKDFQTYYQGYSDKEAKNIIDGQLKIWAKDLRKVQYRVIKDWMKAAKAGKIDFFDLVRGLKTGDVRRAHPYETEFLHQMLIKDKIIDRFRKYFGGKKGKRGRRK